MRFAHEQERHSGCLFPRDYSAFRMWHKLRRKPLQLPAQHGVAQDSGYPKGQPKDSGSPALASTSEVANESAEKMRGPKVEGSEKKSALREQPEESKEGPKRNKP